VDKPEIEFFDPEPPTDLVVTDITEGDGAEATSGSTVEVHYVGVTHSTGEEFDASYNRGSTGSLSSASTPNTHSWTRLSGSR